MLEAEPERRTAIVHLSDDQIVAAVRHVVPGAELTGYRLTTTGRANTNYVVETARDAYVLRIHVRDDALGAKERALYQLVKTSVPVARLLGTGDATLGLGHAFSLLEFVPGETLEAAVAKANSRHLLRTARNLGRVLAKLLTFRFATCGDLVAGAADGRLAVSPWELMDFFQHCLFESPAGSRLGRVRARLWAFLQKAREGHFDPLPIHLAHGDFNPSNLLIGENGEVPTNATKPGGRLSAPPGSATPYSLSACRSLSASRQPLRASVPVRRLPASLRPSCPRRGRGKCGWARTRRACVRPCSP